MELQRLCQKNAEEKQDLLKEIQRLSEKESLAWREHQRQREDLLNLKKLIVDLQQEALLLAGDSVKGEMDYPEHAPDIVLLQKLLGRIHAGLPGGEPARLYREACGQIKGIERRLQELASESSQTDSENLLQDFQENMRGQMTRLFETAWAMLNMKNRQKSGIPDGWSSSLCAGKLTVELPASSVPPDYYFDRFPLSFQNNRFSCPLVFDLKSGSCTFVGYHQETEDQFTSLTKRLLVTAASDPDTILKQILFIDPYRLNGDILDPLTQAVRRGEKSLFRIPESRSEIKTGLSDLLNNCKYKKNDEKKLCRICVLMGYPNEYQSDELQIIRELCYNARKYHLIILLSNDFTEKKMPADYSLPFPAQMIRPEGKSFRLELPEIPGRSETVFGEFEEQTAQNVFFSCPEEKYTLDNRYIKCMQQFTAINLDSSFAYRYKGKDHKALSDLPYALTPDGKHLLKTDFEGIRTFGFVYGVTRSGKSTFLHALITSMILNLHPDDVELWLVDFKMTEFNRYIDHLPPQVRYILLEDSPEMVSDLINRLMEVYKKRRERFSLHRWKDMQDIPEGEYITSIFVIIDEFNVMSSILNREGMEAYRENLEFLITKAAAFGIHLLLSSQNFTLGLAGLSETAKINLGWRASLMGALSEKADTLAIGSPTEHDTRLISTLAQYHVLVKREADDHGNQLDHGKVLYFPEIQDQFNLIELTQNAVQPVKVYDPEDPRTYISKKPETYDGYSYQSFASQEESMVKYMGDPENENDCFISLFPGQPRRMRVVQDIRLRPNVGENMLIVGSPEQSDDMISLILSLVSSCALPGNKCDIALLVKSRHQPFLTAAAIADKWNAADEVIINQDRKALRYLNQLCSQVKEETNRNTLIVLLDYMEFISKETSTHAGHRNFDMSEDELIAVLGGLSDHEADASDMMDPDAADMKDPSEAVAWLLQHGSRRGCHVISVLKSSYELTVTKMNSTDYRHRIFFKAARDDVLDYVKRGEPKSIESMPDHTFRYSNALDAVSYRPYIHPGIIVADFMLDEHGEVVPSDSEQPADRTSDEPDYLD